jgi:hypothetical protein
MRCTLVNRDIPCRENINSHSATELAHYLARRGVDVEIVAVRDPASPEGRPAGKPIRLLPRRYEGKNKLLRLLDSVREGRTMARLAADLHHGPIICMTNPPLLNVWLARLARKRKLRWLYWTMDLYPEAFLAAGLTSERNPLYRWLAKSVTANPPSHVIALGDAQGEHVCRYFKQRPSVTAFPCGIVGSGAEPERPEWARQDGKIILGYAGNLGEAHSEDFVAGVVEQIDPARHRLILAPYGAKAARLRALAEGRPGVVLLESVPREHLRFIDVHLVTLLPRWDHICVPSKAVSAVCEGGSILFHGSEANDNWRLLHEAAWRIAPEAELSEALREFFTGLTLETLAQKKLAAQTVAQGLFALRERALDEIYEKIRELQ